MSAAPAPRCYEELLLDPTSSADGVRLALGMIMSVDGAVAVDGRSSALGGPADRAILPALRDAVDLVLVGAATLRAEGYASIGGSDARRAGRLRKRLAPVPRLAVVTASGDLPADHPLLGSREDPALVVTHAAALEQVRGRLAGRGYLGVVELVVAGEDQLDAEALRRWCSGHGLTRMLCEGGPTLAGLLVDQDAVDEVFVTVSPTLVGGSSARLLVGAAEHLRRLRLMWCETVGDEVLLRYERVQR